MQPGTAFGVEADDDLKVRVRADREIRRRRFQLHGLEGLDDALGDATVVQSRPGDPRVGGPVTQHLDRDIDVARCCHAVVASVQRTERAIGLEGGSSAPAP
ncbi:MAG: hypothetical protein JW940_25410 [Polyangiaceae bacterium]|nr:hypothetical protein [Polyangiaceae bacterium]